MPRSTAFHNIDLSFTDDDLPRKEPGDIAGTYDEQVEKAKNEPGVWKSLGGYYTRGNAATAANGLKKDRYGQPEAYGLHFVTRKVDAELLPEEGRDRPHVVFVRYLPRSVVEGAAEQFQKERKVRREREAQARATKRAAALQAQAHDAEKRKATTRTAAR